MTHANRALAQGAAPWPDDEELVRMMRELRQYKLVADACGKSREALRDYLRVRPALRARMSGLRGARVRVADARAQLDAWREARRARQAGRVGESVEYETIIRRDPCAYGCGQAAQVTDHIHPASRGGEHDWSNYTGACFACNGSKGAKPLLLFLLDHWSAGGQLRPVFSQLDLERSSA